MILTGCPAHTVLLPAEGDEAVISWVLPRNCWPPHAVTHPEKVEQLIIQFRAAGWDLSKEALVGYVTTDGKQYRIQLLSGSHRWEAAMECGMKIPVVIVSEERIENAWGDLDMWRTIMNMGRVHAIKGLTRP